MKLLSKLLLLGAISLGVFLVRVPVIQASEVGTNVEFRTDFSDVVPVISGQYQGATGPVTGVVRVDWINRIPDIINQLKAFGGPIIIRVSGLPGSSGFQAITPGDACNIATALTPYASENLYVEFGNEVNNTLGEWAGGTIDSYIEAYREFTRCAGSNLKIGPSALDPYFENDAYQFAKKLAAAFAGTRIDVLFFNAYEDRKEEFWAQDSYGCDLGWDAARTTACSWRLIADAYNRPGVTKILTEVSLSPFKLDTNLCLVKKFIDTVVPQLEVDYATPLVRDPQSGVVHPWLYYIPRSPTAIIDVQGNSVDTGLCPNENILERLRKVLKPVKVQCDPLGEVLSAYTESIQTGRDENEILDDSACEEAPIISTNQCKASFEGEVTIRPSQETIARLKKILSEQGQAGKPEEGLPWDYSVKLETSFETQTKIGSNDTVNRSTTTIIPGLENTETFTGTDEEAMKTYFNPYMLGVMGSPQLREVKTQLKQTGTYDYLTRQRLEGKGSLLVPFGTGPKELQSPGGKLASAQDMMRKDAVNRALGGLGNSTRATIQEEFKKLAEKFNLIVKKFRPTLGSIFSTYLSFPIEKQYIYDRIACYMNAKGEVTFNAEKAKQSTVPFRPVRFSEFICRNSDIPFVGYLDSVRKAICNAVYGASFAHTGAIFSTSEYGEILTEEQRSIVLSVDQLMDNTNKTSCWEGVEIDDSRKALHTLTVDHENQDITYKEVVAQKEQEGERVEQKPVKNTTNAAVPDVAPTWTTRYAGRSITPYQGLKKIDEELKKGTTYEECDNVRAIRSEDGDAYAPVHLDELTKYDPAVPTIYRGALKVTPGLLQEVENALLEAKRLGREPAPIVKKDTRHVLRDSAMHYDLEEKSKMTELMTTAYAPYPFVKKLTQASQNGKSVLDWWNKGWLTVDDSKFKLTAQAPVLPMNADTFVACIAREVAVPYPFGTNSCQKLLDKKKSQLCTPNTQPGNSSEIAGADKSLMLFGDSMTAAFNENMSILQSKLPGWKINNESWGGRTITQNVNEKLEEAVGRIKPSVLLFESHAYNAFKLTGGTAEQAQMIDKMIEIVTRVSPQTTIVFAATIAPDCAKYQGGPCDVVKQHLENIIRIAVGKPLADAYSSGVNPSYISADTVHPSTVGLEFYGQKIADAVNKVVPTTGDALTQSSSVPYCEDDSDTSGESRGQDGNKLDYEIPYKNTACTMTESQIAEIVKNFGDQNGQGARNFKSLWRQVVTTVKSDINPLFALTLWIEESNANGFSDAAGMGCLYKNWLDDQGLPLVQRVQKQAECLVRTANVTQTFLGFMCRYSGEVGWESGTCNSFVKNPHFPGNVKKWYEIVSQGQPEGCQLQEK